MPFVEVPPHQVDEDGVVDEAPIEAVDGRGKSADTGGGHDSVGPHHPECLSECGHPLAPIGQVVERSQQQYGVERPIWVFERSSVAEARRRRCLQVAVG